MDKMTLLEKVYMKPLLNTVEHISQNYLHILNSGYRYITEGFWLRPEDCP